MVEVFATKCNWVIEDELLKVLEDSLGKQHRLKAKKYKFRNDRILTVVCRVMLRKILCNKLKISNTELVFYLNDYGKPFSTYEIEFNCSHSGNWVVCGVSNSAIGIDIEKIDNIDLSLVKMFFSERENCDIYEKVPEERLKYFFDLWTLKESYIKALGKGLTIELSSFDIKKEGDKVTIRDMNMNERPCFYQYNMFDDYVLSVCSFENDFCESINFIEMKDIVSFAKANMNNK